jgi:site-specific recombinase XerD
MIEKIDITQLKVATTHWMEDFKFWLRENDRVEITVSAYMQDLRHFSEFFHFENASAFSPDQLNATDVKKYFAGQDADKSVAPASRNRRLASLRVLVHWAVKAGLLEYDPTISIKRQPVEPSPRDRSGDEMARLNATVSAGSHLKCNTENHIWLGMRDHAIWILFNSAGLRESEVAGLDVSDLDFSENKISIYGKGAKKASIDMQEGAMNEISEWLKQRGVKSDAVITDWKGNRITRSTVWRRIKMIGAAADVDNLKPHDLRHTFAYAYDDALKSQGVPEFARMNGVRKQMRHADMKTTALYFGIRDSQIRAALEVM